MIVVDTNIIAYITFQTPHTAAVSALHSHNSHWVTPQLWRSEFLNVMSLYYRKGLLLADELLPTLLFAENLAGRNEDHVTSMEVLNIVRICSCSSYDCEFIALAKKLSIPLITYDKQILKEFPTLAFKPEDYISQRK